MLDVPTGYWQIPLTPVSWEKRPFPFGLFDAPVMFQCLMDRILHPHGACDAAYLDDIIIYSNDWQQHLQLLGAVLRSLTLARLIAKPKNCALGRWNCNIWASNGQVHPTLTATTAAYARTKTKKGVRQSLALAGYYIRIVPNFLGITSPLTDLTKKSECQIRSSHPSHANGLLPM